jgi:para-nitrobenzyl esterase
VGGRACLHGVRAGLPAAQGADHLLWQEGKAHDVPFLAGSNRDEMGWLVGELAVRGHFRQYADAVFKLFPDKARSRAGTVSIFTSVARADVQAMSRHSSKAFLYQFTRTAPPWRLLGVFHASEIPYVFGNLDPKLSFEAQDRYLSRTMMSYWINFARSGDPNGEGLPKWPAYDVESDTHMELGDVVRAGKNLEKSACDGLDHVRAERIEKRKSR